jgi:uncharacterized protein (DUF2141 family)
MPNLKRLVIGAAALAATAPAGAAIVGPHAGDCARGDARPAMLVRIEGLKSRTGTLRIQTYGGDPRHYFDKGAYLERVEVPTPRSGTVEVCMPVPRSGAYAVSVRHDANGDGTTDRNNDGGGFSGNPSISLFDVIFKRKPSPAQVQVRVADGVVTVPVILNYLKGTTVGPIGG